MEGAFEPRRNKNMAESAALKKKIKKGKHGKKYLEASSKIELGKRYNVSDAFKLLPISLAS